MEVQKVNNFYYSIIHGFMEEDDCLHCVFHCVNKSIKPNGKNNNHGNYSN